MFAAIGRGQHRQLHAQPWVLDDPFALPFVGPAWPGIYAALSQAFGEPIIREAIGFICGRSRYAEDRLAPGAFTQYVILGAGLDSFAWRRPDLLGSLRVFEMDHPASQAWKRERIEVLALPASDRHVFTPVDFETATLRDGLDAVGFDWSQLTLYSCLGVFGYLTVDAIEATLRTVASGAAGSQIVASYAVTQPFLDDNGEKFRDIIMRLAADSGEEIKTFLSPTEIEAVFEGCSLQVADHLSRDDLYHRYFAGRPDALTPYTVERLITATVPA